jgi:hypothetical protein
VALTGRGFSRRTGASDGSEGLGDNSAAGLEPIGGGRDFRDLEDGKSVDDIVV